VAPRRTCSISRLGAGFGPVASLHLIDAEKKRYRSAILAKGTLFAVIYSRSAQKNEPGRDSQG